MITCDGPVETVVSKLVTKETEKILQSSAGLQESLAFAMLNSNEDRHSFAKRRIRNLDSAFPEINSGARKCSLTAEMLKSEGNNAFGLRQYEKAQELFTLSAAYAVPDHIDASGKNTLAVSIGNRSGSLFKLGKYKETLVDIENALQVGYPEDLQYKLYFRKGKCHQAFKSYKEAKVAFQLAESLLDKATLSEGSKKTTLNQIQKDIEFCDRNRDTDVELTLDLKGELPKLADKPNTTHPSLSSACRVEYKPGKGRYVVAARDIKPGEVLLVEKPFAAIFVPNQDYKDGCHHCFYPCDTLLPCLKCTKARYCSTDCRDVAWETYHKFECGIPLHNLVGAGTSEHLIMRIVMVAGLDYLLEFQKEQKLPKKLSGCNEAGQYLSSDYTSVYHLQRNTIIPGHLFFCAAYISVFLTKLLEKMRFFDSIVKEKKDKAMACVGECLISHYVTGFVYISHHIPILDAKEVREMVGYSVPSTCSLFGHSCDLDTNLTFHGSNAVVHAMRSFKQGQEVTMNHGQPFGNMDKKSRQEYLQQLHFIDCACKPCQGDWPLQRDLSCVLTFKCTECEVPLRTSGTTVLKCPRCKHTHSVQAKMQSLNTATKLYNEVRQSFNMPLLWDYVAAIDKLLVQPYKDYVDAKGMITRWLWDNGSHLQRQYKE